MNMPELPAGLNVLSAMITPAVLISACGQLIFSTSNRLGRIVDRVRELTRVVEQLFAGVITDFPEERRHEVDIQIGFYAQRSRLVQEALTSFYVALGLFVATTLGIGLTAFIPEIAFLPGILGIVGTITLFYGSMLLIREARLALRSVNQEMEFTLRLGRLYQEKRQVLGGGTAH
jgi:threonine/homoserine/homoserine lactone efflux protein